MNQILKIITVVVACVLVVTLWPAMSIATTSSTTGLAVPALPTAPALSTPTLTTPSLSVPTLTSVPLLSVPTLSPTPSLTIPSLPTSTTTSGSHTASFCRIVASTETVASGGSVTISWETAGFASVTINNEAVAVGSGSRTFTNITENTTYTLRATSADGRSNCTATVTVTCLPPAVIPDPLCTLTASKTTIVRGESTRLTWTTTNADRATFNQGIGTVSLSGNRDVSPTQTTTYTLTVVQDRASGFKQVTCPVTVTVNEPPVVPLPTCVFTPLTTTIAPGQSVSLSWITTEADQVSITNFGSVAVTGTQETPALSTSTTYVLTAVQSSTSRQVVCEVVVIVQTTPPVTPLPTCDTFTALPQTILAGASTTLSWNTSNATQVFINNAIGAVPADGSISVRPLATTVYRLTVLGVSTASVHCDVQVTVTPDTVPVCTSFTATPSSLPVGGGTTTLAWNVTNATSVSISPNVGSVALTGTSAQTVTGGLTYTLTATDADGDSVSCQAPVTVVNQPVPFTCANAVVFSASNSSLVRGQSTTLTWSTTNVDSLTITDVATPTLSGSVVVTPDSTATYVLTAVRGTESVSCPVAITVSTGGGGGGGGGGSSSPRCELTISDTVIDRGEQVTLTWDTSRATEVSITDDRNNIVMTTATALAREKSDLYDGTIRVSPSRDTTYTLLATRGSRDRECTVNVRVRDNVVVLESRDQQPLVAGIALSDVPYTGFAASPLLTIIFYLLLGAWAALIAYFLVIRRDSLVGYDFATVQTNQSEHSSRTIVSAEPHIDAQIESIRPDLFVAAIVAPVERVYTAPDNLPTAAPVVGYDAYHSTTVAAPEIPSTNPHHATDAVVTALENRAHAQKALLSSDAIRHFIATTDGSVARDEALDTIISNAKNQYPLEDGWIVINESRMQNLCEVCRVDQMASTTAPFIPATIPEGSGSLAEAIVSGNIVAAYEMIGNRPMFALADAASDLDAVVRLRKGAEVTISDMLRAETAKLSDEQLFHMIGALTGALDGTYTDEASAVKMAIMKAVKAAA